MLKGIKGFHFCFVFLLVAFNLLGQNGQDINKEKLDSLAKSYNNIGVDYAIAGDFKNASLLFQKSLDIKQLIPGFSKSRLASGYLNLANIKQRLKSADTALIFYKKAEGFINQIDKPDKTLLGTIYVEMGDCYLGLNDLQAAIPLIKQGISLIESDSIPDYYKIILAKLKLASALRTTGLLNDAIKSGEAVLILAKKHQPNFIYAVHNNLGNTYLVLKEFQKALSQFKIAEKLLDNGKEQNTMALVSLFNNIGFCNQKLLQHLEAENYYSKALRLNNSIGSIPDYCLIYNNLGVIKVELGLLDQAKLLVLKSLGLNRVNVANNSLVNLESFYSISQAIFSYQYLGRIYAKQYQKSKEKGIAIQSISAFKKAIQLAEDIRIGLNGEEDKLLVAEKYNRIFELAIEGAIIFSVDDTSFIDQTFRFISKSKAGILHELISKNRGKTISGIPKDIQRKENDLKIRLDYLNEKLYEDRKVIKSGNAQLESLEEQVFKLQSEYRSMIKNIEIDYPKYYSLKYDTSSMSIRQIQSSLSDNKILIEYYKTDSMLISFAITKSNVKYNFQRLDRTFYENLKIFREELVPEDFSSISTDNVKRFSASSHKLYSILLKPYEEDIKGREIIIIPNNELISIPFIALVTDTLNSSAQFYSLPYLVKTNPISYSLSSKLFIEQREAPQIYFINSISVAPSYKGNTTGLNSNRVTYRQSLSELPGARNEVEIVSEVFHGTTLLDDVATESRFKAIASNYDIIHLAMHTFIDDKNPNFSKLIFTQTSDSVDDGFLNAYEIYNLKIKSRLTIISACRSGDGNLIKGEGIIGLARGFFYAGCPSLITTQWRVDDSSSSELIVDFSRLIKKGNMISNSLQTAQRNFIERSDPLRSHPYFWAAYQVIGSDNPVTPKGVNFILISISALVLVVFVAVYYLRFLK